MPVITTTGRSFSQTALDILTKTNISANAFKLYCLAFTFPKNWKFVRSDLQQRLKFGSANTVKKAVLELIELGLVTGSFTTDLTFYDHSIRSDSLLDTSPEPGNRYISVLPDSSADNSSHLNPGSHLKPGSPVKPGSPDKVRTLIEVSLREFFRPITVSALDAEGLPVSFSDSSESFSDLRKSDGRSFFDFFSAVEESFFDRAETESQKMTNSCFINNNTNKQTNKQQRKFSKNDQEANFDHPRLEDTKPDDTETARKETPLAETAFAETDPLKETVIPPQAVPPTGQQAVPPAVPSAVQTAVQVTGQAAVQAAVQAADPVTDPVAVLRRAPQPERTPIAGNPFAEISIAGNPQRVSRAEDFRVQVSRTGDSRSEGVRSDESRASKIDFTFPGSASKIDFTGRGDGSKNDISPVDASENDFSTDVAGQKNDAAFPESVRDAGRIMEEVEKRCPKDSPRFQAIYDRVSRILWCPGIFTEVLLRATGGLILGLKGFTLQEFEWLAKRADRESQKNGKQKWQMVNLSLTRLFEAQTPAWTYSKCKPGMALRPAPPELRILPQPVPSNYAPYSGYSSSGGQKMTFPAQQAEEEEDLYDDSPEESLAEAEAAGIDWETDGYNQMVNKVAKYLQITNIDATFRIRRYRDALRCNG